MVMQLVVIAGPDEGLTIELDRENGTRLGRSQSILTHLTDPHVSRVHAELHVQEGQVLVADSNSAGGTFVNGRRVGRQALRPGDIIQVGATQLRFDNTEGRVEQTTLAPGALGRPATSTEELTGLTGQMLGRYEIGPILSRGKSSCVFRAKDTADGRTVALKVLHPEFTQDDEDMQRFVRAMKTMLPLRHPNLVQIENAGRTGTYCWVAMEFVEGESLRQVIERIGVAGMLDWRHAIRIGIHIGRALEYAHGQQIIHRNVTPANILIRSSDQVAKLADLMLAKALEGALAQPITRPGELLGDLNYMSPERTRGTAEIDGRSDIYGLGATLYALLTGRPPFHGGSLPETVSKIRQAEPEKAKKYQLSTPDLFEGTVMRMLAKRPEDRPQTATELLTQLDRVAKYQGVTV